MTERNIEPDELLQEKLKLPFIKGLVAEAKSFKNSTSTLPTTKEEKPIKTGELSGYKWETANRRVKKLGFKNLSHLFLLAGIKKNNVLDRRELLESARLTLEAGEGFIGYVKYGPLASEEKKDHWNAIQSAITSKLRGFENCHYKNLHHFLSEELKNYDELIKARGPMPGKNGKISSAPAKPKPAATDPYDELPSAAAVRSYISEILYI